MYDVAAVGLSTSVAGALCRILEAVSGLTMSDCTLSPRICGAPEEQAHNITYIHPQVSICRGNLLAWRYEWSLTVPSNEQPMLVRKRSIAAGQKLNVTEGDHLHMHDA